MGAGGSGRDRRCAMRNVKPVLPLYADPAKNKLDYKQEDSKMPIEKDVDERAWCPGGWPWEWFDTCIERKHKWCYQFSWVKETGYGAFSYLEGCEKSTLYTWYKASFLVFGGRTYPAGEMCFDSPRGKSGGCDASRTGLLASPLMEGEKASDPWLLRIKPKSSSSYETPSDATLADRQVSSPKELRCQMFDVREWEIGAIAYIQGSQLPPITFQWKFDGTIVNGSSVDTSTTSTFTVTKPAVGATKKLSVTATDTNGFSSTRTVDVTLGTISIHCDHVLYFVPLEIPTNAPGPIEITSPKVNQLLLEINDLATRDFVR